MEKKTEVKTEVLNVRLPDDIIKWIDSLVHKGIYNSRSEALRHFIREYISDNKDKLIGAEIDEGANDKDKGDYIG
jgi:Arc/MetJ-type ribon-helix-helix transcriptional regulator